MTIDKKVDCIKLAKAVVRQTRNDVLISKTQMTDIAVRCGIKESTLAHWRSDGIGPKFVKVGRTVMYPKEPMIEYFRDHLYQCTTEYEEE